MSDPLRVLLVADSHLGFDTPRTPRVDRRRRGPDFFQNFTRVLEAAAHHRVDLVVHGGDVFHRSRVPQAVVLAAREQVASLTARGIPMVIVPGNHERSVLPHRLFWSIPGVHVFDSPETHRLECRGRSVALTGFPFHRKIRDVFPALIAAADPWAEPADIRLLCLHQTVEGARVGPVGYTFRSGGDVIPGRAIPSGFAAVLCGHIHRRQILRTDLRGRALGAPVLYPGSIERTAFAERDEPKGYMLLGVEPGQDGGRMTGVAFRELPARPMVSVELNLDAVSPRAAATELRQILATLPPDAVVRLKVVGSFDAPAVDILQAVSLRRLAPSTMNVDIAWPRAASAPSTGNRRPAVR